MWFEPGLIAYQTFQFNHSLLELAQAYTIIVIKKWGSAV